MKPPVKASSTVLLILYNLDTGLLTEMTLLYGIDADNMLVTNLNKMASKLEALAPKAHLKQMCVKTMNCCLNDLQKKGREQFHGLGSMYCRGADAVILTYDVTNWQSLAELEDRFLAVTDTAKPDCIFAIVGNKVDLTDDCALFKEAGDESSVQTMGSPRLQKQVHMEDAVMLYKRILKYKMLEEKDCLPAEKMCFETSTKTSSDTWRGVVVSGGNTFLGLPPHVIQGAIINKCGPWFSLLSLGLQECDAETFSRLRKSRGIDFGSNQKSKTLLRKNPTVFLRF